VVREGVLALSGSGAIASSSSITVTANGKLDVSGLDAGSWSPAAAQTLGGSGIVTGNVVMAQGTIAPGVGGIGTLSFSNNLSQAGSFVTTNLFEIGAGGNDKILVAGDLSLSETITIRVVPTGIVIPNGTYTLIKWGGNLTGDLSNLALENPAQTGTLVLGLNPTTKEIYLTVTGVSSSANLTWKGNVLGDWDITTANWLNGVSPSVFATGDKVTFDDSSATASVNLVIDASPGNVLVNAAKDYVFDNGGGIGKITGTTSLVKSNSGALTLVTDNDYTGATVIQGGTVLIGDGNNLRGKFGSGVITNNAKVGYNRPDDFHDRGHLLWYGFNR
jgi:autotransporter-associated beta strand protein